MKEQQVVIITGMHRSGTSLVSSVIQKAGVNIGDNLIGSFQGNLRGHFEDQDFVKFHEEVLTRFNQSHLVTERSALGPITASETQTAQQLIQQRADYQLWGWKDPRTALFLDLWHNLLPKAYFILVFRHPIEVTLSLLRRGLELDIDVCREPMIGLQVWQVYNQAILNFYRQHREVCLLCHIANITASIEGFIKLATGKLALPIQLGSPQNLYHPGELKQLSSPAELNLVLSQIVPDIARLYEELETEADLPGGTLQQPSTEAKAFPVVNIVERIAALRNPTDDTGLQSTKLFSVLLALLEPETILTSKGVAEKFQTTRINNLETHAKNLEQLLENKTQQIQQLKERLENKDQQLQQLKERLENKDQQIQQLKEHLENKDQQIQQLAASSKDIKTKLEEIENSKAWQFILKWYAFKDFLSRKN